MKFTTLAAATLVALATAAPTIETRQSDNKFSLRALRSESAIHDASFSAVDGSLLLALSSGQNATCESTDPGYATFYLNNGSLFLYTPDNVTQELYTDRSGMGQGVLQYSTSPGGYQPGRNAETTGWAVSDNALTFDGKGLIACPSSIGGAWSVWTDAGVSNPGHNSGCLSFSVETLGSSDPTACVYTYRSA